MVGQYHGPQEKCEIRNVVCTATAEWPELFTGVLELDPIHLRPGSKTTIGTLLFPEDIGEVEQISLLCHYFMDSGY